MTLTTTIWAYSDPMLMRTALIGVQAVMTDPAFRSLVTVFFLFALIATIFPAMFNFSSITRYYISIFAVVTIMTMPTMNVTIVPTDDPTLGAITVPNVPTFVALPAAVFSTSGKWMAEKFESVAFVLMGLSPDLRVFGANGGMVGGSIMALMKTTTMVPPAALSSSVSLAFNQCVIPSAVLWGDQFPNVAIKTRCQKALGATPTTPVKAIDCLSNVDSLFALQNMVDPMPISTGSGVATDCKTFSNSIVTKLKAWAGSYYANKMESGSTSISRNYKAVMSHLEKKCVGGSCTGLIVADTIAGQTSAVLLTQALLGNAASSNGSASASLVSLRAKVGAGTLAGQSLLAYMPLAMDAILAFMTLLFPLVTVVLVLSAAQGGTVGKLGNFYTSYFAMSLVPSIMAIINSFMTYFIVYKSSLAAQLSGQLGNIIVSPAAVLTISSLSEAPASAMGYMMAAAPVITWSIVNSGAVPAGQMLGNMMQGGSQAQEAAALGNISANGLNVGNRSVLEKDNVDQANGSMVANGNLASFKHETSKISGNQRAQSLSSVSATEDSTGTSDISTNTGVHAAVKNGLADSATSELSQKIGAAQTFKKDAEHNGTTLSASAKSIGEKKSYNDALKVKSDNEGIVRAASEQPSVYGGDGEYFSDLVPAYAKTAEGQSEATVAKGASIRPASEATGRTNYQRERDAAKLSAIETQGKVVAANKSEALTGKSVLKQASTAALKGRQEQSGAVNAANMMQESTGLTPEDTGFYKQLADYGKTLGAGAGFGLALDYLKTKNLSKNDLVNMLGVGTAAEVASKIGLANNIAKLNNHPEGIIGMSQKEIGGLIGHMAKSSVPKAIDEEAQNRHGEQIAETFSSEGTSDLSGAQDIPSNLANISAKDLLRSSNFGSIIGGLINNKGGLKKLDSMMKKATMHDAMQMFDQIHQGGLAGNVNGAQVLGAAMAEKTMADPIAAMKEFKDNPAAYGRMTQAIAQGQMAKNSAMIEAHGGAASFLSAQGFDGTIAGRKSASFMGAVGDLDQNQMDLLSLNGQDDYASYGKEHGMTSEQVGTARQMAGEQLLANADEWGRSLGIKEFGHGTFTNLTGTVASFVGDMGHWNDQLFNGGDEISRHGQTITNKQGHVSNHGTSFLDQVGAILSIVGLKGAASGLKMGTKLLKSEASRGKAIESIKSFFSQFGSKGTTQAAKRIEPTVSKVGKKVDDVFQGTESVGNLVRHVSPQSMVDKVSAAERTTAGNL